MPSAERLMKPVMFRIPCLERVQNWLMCCFCQGQMLPLLATEQTLMAVISVSVSRTQTEILLTTHEQIKNSSNAPP